MKFFPFCTALLLLFVSAVLYAQDVPPAYDPKAAAGLLGLEPYIAPEGFYPVYPWDWFPQEFKPYETLDKSIPGVKECGFNFAGFIKPKDLKQCDKLGLKAMVAIEGADWEKMTSEEIDAKIKTVVEESKGHPCVIGYYLRDEPGAKLFPA
ncbi:MAG: hypothetical protein LBN39_05025, partial [Planctomycetaceae bacterium]|nr:hypothetical protein [Planctomycetaceae bacterium]